LRRRRVRLHAAQRSHCRRRTQQSGNSFIHRLPPRCSSNEMA
jgi:hypothetical protein